MTKPCRLFGLVVLLAVLLSGLLAACGEETPRTYGVCGPNVPQPPVAESESWTAVEDIPLSVQEIAYISLETCGSHVFVAVIAYENVTVKVSGQQQQNFSANSREELLPHPVGTTKQGVTLVVTVTYEWRGHQRAQQHTLVYPAEGTPTVRCHAS